MGLSRLCFRTFFLASLGLFFSACGGNGGTLPQQPPSYESPARVLEAIAPKRHQRASGKITHVVIIVQENRSFNNLFYGFKGATTAQYGYTTTGEKVKLEPVVLETNWDLGHDPWSFEYACNGKGRIPGTDCRMNGFNNESVECGKHQQYKCPIKHPQYAYVPHNEIKPYFAMGEQYVLADQMYQSNLDESFVAHQYLIAGQAASSVGIPSLFPWGCKGGAASQIRIIGPKRQLNPSDHQRPCYKYDTLGEEADKAGVTWGFYTGNIGDVGGSYGTGGSWSAYQAVKNVYYGPDWHNDIFVPQTKFYDDVKKGKLREITWITPTAGNSDHPGSGSNTGPAWVASLVNAVGKSKYWDSTAIFITWDDWGGWYDPEPPAYADYDGLGFRVPLLIVSAYAKKGHVSHVHYEFGSILKFVEDQFGLPRLAASDTRAKSPEKDCFDFKQAPRPFQMIPSEHGEDYFLHQPPDYRPPDND